VFIASYPRSSCCVERGNPIPGLLFDEAVILFDLHIWFGVIPTLNGNLSAFYLIYRF